VEKAPEPVLTEADKKALVGLLNDELLDDTKPDTEPEDAQNPDIDPAELAAEEVAKILETTRAEAQAAAEEIRQRARNDASALVESAKQDAESIKSTAQSEAVEMRAEAKTLGYDEGKAAAISEAEEKFKTDIAAKTRELEADFSAKLSAETEQLRSAYEIQLEQLRGEALDFALSVVHKIFGENRDELYTPLIVNALTQLGIADTDTAIETDYGKVIIDAGSETIDASLNSQLERLRESVTGG
jgi:cell division septum initiation protein DivIVA